MNAWDALPEATRSTVTSGRLPVETCEHSSWRWAGGRTYCAECGSRLRWRNSLRRHVLWEAA